MDATEADRLIKRAERGWQDEEPETESPLQSKIVQWAHAHGYPCHAHPQSKHYIRAHTKGAGWVDVTLCVQAEMIGANPRVLFLELKAKKGAMREAQLKMEQVMCYMGCEYHRVRTWKRFMEVINGNNL